MKKRLLSSLLVLVLILGTFTQFDLKAYAATTEPFSITWEQKGKISDIINIAGRKESTNDLVLNWEYGKANNIEYKAPTDKYVMTYHLTDGEDIELTVSKATDTTTKIAYRVKQYTLNPDGTYSSTSVNKPANLLAYDEKSSTYYQYSAAASTWNKEVTGDKWINSKPYEADSTIFAPAGITVLGNTAAGNGNGADITLEENKAIAFKYDGKLVTLKWNTTKNSASKEYIQLGIDGIEPSKIYDFNISLTGAGKPSYQNSINVMKLLNYEVNPVGAATIDKTAAGKENEYAGKDPELDIKFEVPKVWNTATKTYASTSNYSDNKGYNGLKAIINLNTSSTGKNPIQIEVPNVYQAAPINAISGAVVMDGTAKVETENGVRYHSFRLKNAAGSETIQSSSLYTVAQILLEPTASVAVQERSRFYTIAVDLSSGKNAYTYLEYNTETKGNGERVLKVKPYNVNGTYYIHMSNGGEFTSIGGLSGIPKTVIAKYDYLVSSEITELEIPIAANGTTSNSYMIDFEYEKGVITSQILIDRSSNAKYLITPELTVKNYKIITQTNNDGSKTEKLRMALSWSGGDVTIFNPLTTADKSVKYKFAKTPFSPREGNYKDFLTISADTQVTGQDPKTGEDIIAYTLNIDANDNVGNNNGATLLAQWGENLKTGGINKATILSDKTEISEVIFTAIVEFDITKNDNLGSRVEPSTIFYYPSVYYMKMNGSYKNDTGIDKSTAYCNPVNITLDEKSKTILPPPQNYAVANITSKGFNASWSTVADSVYGEYIATNNYTMSTEGAGVNIFVTQKNVLGETDAQKQLAYFTDPNNIVMVKYDASIASEVNGVRTIDLSKAPTIINAIRNNKMIKITDVPQDIDLKTQVVNIVGLDKNTIYNTALQTLINVYSNNDINKEVKQVVSDSVSQILTLTTKAEDVLVEPDPSEVPPKSPADFRQDTDAEQAPTKTTLIWTEVEDTESINEINTKKEYEIVRVDKKLDNTLLSKRSSFDTFWNENLKDFSSTQKVAWQTDSAKQSPSNLKSYNAANATGSKWVPTQTTEQYSYEYEKRNPTLEFVDKTLLPNRIYYYYIRTVRMKEVGGVYSEAAYSSWEPVTITTNPIAAPIDLQLERNTTYFNYDKEKEMNISFFVAIPAGTSMADMAALYPLEYSIMEDGGEWKTVTIDVTNSALFKAGNVKKEGYQQFVYKITGLTQGKGYSVRVRMKSRVNSTAEATAVYDISLYSNTVQFRTDMNQSEYDTDEGIKKWLGLFDDQLLAISTKNYWIVNNSNSNYEAIYRTSTFGGELQKATSGVYTFEANGQDKQIYYIPAQTLLNTNNANVGFKLVNGDMEVLIRPNSIDVNTTEAIADVLSKIKEGTVKDYFIKIQANWNEARDMINNSQALSDHVQIQMSVVGTKELEKTLDANFVGLFNKAIGDASTNDIRNDLKQDLKDAIKDKDTNEELYKLVTDAVAKAYDDIIDDIEHDFDNNTKYNYDIDTLEENMLITAAVNGQTTVSGYRRNNTTWEVVTTNNYGTKKGFEIKLLGLFVFAGKNINIPDVDGITNSSAVKELIAKYGLDDYFGKDIINVDTNATKYMVVGSVARISGATPTQSELTYLKGKGVNISSGKMYNEISNQEALYLVMSLYEIRTGSKVSTIKITNYNALPDIASFDTNYKKSAQAAAQLGIYTNTSLGANSNITVRTLLEYLGNLSNKIKL